MDLLFFLMPGCSYIETLFSSVSFHEELPQFLLRIDCHPKKEAKAIRQYFFFRE